MYAKMFKDIFDSSIADNRDLRHFFMDMITLADIDFPREKNSPVNPLPEGGPGNDQVNP
jgi:hypothetical protein